MFRIVRQQAFLVGILIAVLLAFLAPELAGMPYASAAANLAVILIFFLQGLSLATRKMLLGARPLRAHCFVLAWNFILYPALAGLLLLPLSLLLGSGFRMGFWMLAILPTTIASATAMTAAARAAVPQAIFASIFSNLLAILVVPLLALAYLRSGGAVDLPLLPILTKLFWLVVLPLLMGQVIRRCLREASIALSRRLGWLPQLAILFILYLAFAESVGSGVIKLLQLEQLLLVLFGLCLLMLIASWAIWISSGWLRILAGERVAVFFTASQKSIATGLPLLSSIFAAAALPAEETVFVLLPLIIYHPLQLALGGLLLSRLTPISDSAPSVQ